MLDHGTERVRRATRGWWFTGVMAVLVAASAVSFWLGSRVSSPAQVAARAAEPKASWITAKVDRRVLRSTVIVRGDVRPESSVLVQVPASVSGTAVVTGVHVSVGDEVAEGARLVEVSGRPVFVLAGGVPVYRTLKPGMQGADVAELQEALARLGYSPDRDGTFGTATKAAVQAFYAASGYVPEPSSPTLDADLASAKATVDQTQAGLDAAEADLLKAAKGPEPSAIASAQAALKAAQRALADAQVKADADQKDLKAKLDAAQDAYDRLVAASSTTSSTSTTLTTVTGLTPDGGPPVSTSSSVPTSVPTQADIDQAKLALTQAQTDYDETLRTDQGSIATAADQVKVANLTLSEAQAPPDVSAATTARDNAKHAHDAAVTAYAAVLAGSGPTVAQGEVVFAPSLPARVQSAVSGLGALDSASGSGGADGGPAGAGGGAAGSGLVTLAAGNLVVATTLHPGDVGLVRQGMGVELLDETTSTTYGAKVSSVATTPTTGADGQLGYAAVVGADPALPASLAGANLRVTITAAATSGEVLVVPLGAVSSDAGGRTRVSVLRDGATVPVDVPVTAGLSADGFVAVEPAAGAALRPGDEVVVGR